MKTPRRRASPTPAGSRGRSASAPGPGFSFDAEREIWLATDHEKTFAYSDGEGAEAALLATMSQVSERRVGSEALESAIHDWVTRYHLSANRANLLRPLRKLLTGRVLEVGAGCGALTRYLGETARSVVALEGSPRRATICRARCADLPNVQVVCADVMRDMPEGPFDAVILVGVLEYAGWFGGGGDPHLDLLRRCREALAPTGVLVLAIENRLGLKYFAGAPEDHIGVPFAGLHDAYGAHDPRTFGRLELEDLLGRAGLRRRHLLFPFPDYKFPRAVVSEAGLDSRSEEIADVVASLAAENQSQPYDRSLSEEATWPSLIRNGVGKDLANSFLIVAGRRPAPTRSTDLAHCYSLSWRRCFQKETVLRQGRDGMVAHREPLYPAEPKPKGPYRQRLDTGRFVKGELWGRGIYGIVNQPGWTIAQIAEWARPWVDYLIEHSSAAPSGETRDRRVAPTLLDCTPFNVVKTGSGRLTPFDQEWAADEPQPLGYILFRGLLTSFLRVRSTAVPDGSVAPTIGAVIAAVGEALGVPLDQASLDACAEAEARLQAFVSGVAQDPRGLLALPMPPQRGPTVAAAPQELGALEPLASEPVAEADWKVLREQVDVLQAALAARDTEMARLRFELSEADEATQGLGRRINDCGRQIVRLEAALYAADPKAIGLEQEAAAIPDEAVEVEEGLRAFEQRGQELEQRNAELALQLQEYQAAVEKLTGELASVESQIQDLELRNANAERELLEQQAVADGLRNMLAQRELEITSTLTARLEAEKAKLGDALSLERSKAAEAAAHLARERDVTRDLAARNESLVLETERGSRDLMAVQRALDSERQEAGQLASRVATLETRLAEAHEIAVERDDLALRIRRLELQAARDAEEAEHHAIAAAATQRTLQAALSEAQARSTSLEFALHDVEDKYQEQSASLRMLTETNNELVDAHERQKELATSLEAQLAEKQALLVQVSDWATGLKSHADQLTSELAAITRSHSWRFTRPLREFGILVRNPGRLFRRAPGMPLRGLGAGTGLRRLARKLLDSITGAPSSPTARRTPRVMVRPGVTIATGAPAAAAGAQGLEDIFMWGVIDWHFRIQRPQQIARELARRGHNVYYISSQFIDSHDVGFAIEPIPVPDSDRHVSVVRFKVPQAPLIYFAAATPEIQARLLDDVAQLLGKIGSGRPINVVQHPYWLPIIERMPNQRLVYDCMDNHGGFGNNSSDILALETLLTRRADLVVVTSTWIERAAQALNPHVAIVHNACEPGHFAERPQRVYTDRQRRPIIGYYGAIAEWFDTDLVLQLAAEIPSALVLLVGADTAGVGEATRQVPNIVMTGEVPYNDLPFYLHAFDVCILPFKINELTLATNPVKAYEYLSAGKPVVSVDLPELSCFDGLVARATQPGEFVEKVREALRSPGSPRVRRARMRFGAAHSWGARAETLETAVRATPVPLISVVIVTYNNRALSQACFESIEALTDYPRYEVIVVDNASTDGSPDFIAEYCRSRDHWHCILNTTNRGFSAANNQGLAAARGDFLVLLNNDTVVTRGWLGTLAGHLKRDETIGLVGPVTNNIGNEARIVTQYAEIAAMHGEARTWTLAHIGQTREMRTLAFFCVMMPRRVYERVGPLDEAFGVGMFEDDDYCRRIEREHWRIVCAEDVFIHHTLSASLDLLGAERRAKLFQVNRGIYESKWGKWVPHVYRD